MKMASDFTSVTTVEDIDALDEGEMIEGYWDGYDGDPEPGNNRSRAYWHGWRNGAVDGKHWQGDEAQMIFARAVVNRNRGKLNAVLGASRQVNGAVSDGTVPATPRR
jgi:hypothetical protein